MELADDFVSSYIPVGTGGFTREPRSAERSKTITSSRPVSASWPSTRMRVVEERAGVGRLGADCIVTVASKGDPARGQVLRLPAPRS